MAKINITDSRLRSSLNPAIVMLRDAGWISIAPSGETDDSEALVGDITRGGTIVHQRKFVNSASAADFEEKIAAQRAEIYDEAIKEENISNSRDFTIAVAKLNREAVRNFLIEALFPEAERDDETLASINKMIDRIFTSYNQDMTALAKHAISTTMLGTRFMPVIDELKTTSNLMIKKEGEVCLRTRMGIRLIEPDSDDVEKNKIGIEVPGAISWEFVLTPAGFKLNYIDFSNSLLQDLCLSERKNVSESSLRQAAFEEKGKQKGGPEGSNGDSAEKNQYSDDSDYSDDDITPSLDDEDVSSSEYDEEQDEDAIRYGVTTDKYKPKGIIGFLRNTLNLIYSQFISAYTMAYPPDGLDPVTNTFNGEKIKYGPATRFSSHPLTLITSFLGLPNGNPTLDLSIDEKDPDEEISVQSIGNLFWRFISWDDNQVIGVNVLRAPIAAAFHLLMVIPKLVVNIAKLVTEFLPTLGAQIFGRIARNFDKKLNTHLQKEKTNYALIIGWGALYSVAKTAETIFKILNFVGRAITSPILNIRSAKQGGEQLSDWLVDQISRLLINQDSPEEEREEKTEKIKKITRAVIGNTFGFLTAAFTVAIYAVAAPIGAKIALGTILPHAPGFIGVAIKAAIPVISTVAKAIGTVAMPIMGPLTTALGLSLSPMALVGTAVLTSVIGNEAAKGLKAASGRVMDRVASWFRKPATNNDDRRAQPAVSDSHLADRPTPSAPVSTPRSTSSADSNHPQAASPPVENWHGSPKASSPGHAGMFAHHDTPIQKDALTEQETEGEGPKRENH